MEEEEVDVGAREFLKLESRVVVEWNFWLVLVRGKLNLTLQFVQVWLLIGSRNIRLAFNLLSIYLQQIALVASTHKIYSTSLLRVFEFPNSNKHHFILDYAIVPLFFFSLYAFSACTESNAMLLCNVYSVDGTWIINMMRNYVTPVRFSSLTVPEPTMEFFVEFQSLLLRCLMFYRLSSSSYPRVTPLS